MLLSFERRVQCNGDGEVRHTPIKSTSSLMPAGEQKIEYRDGVGTVLDSYSMVCGWEGKQGLMSHVLWDTFK
jgi:hypothetical protein